MLVVRLESFNLCVQGGDCFLSFLPYRCQVGEKLRIEIKVGASFNSGLVKCLLEAVYRRVVSHQGAPFIKISGCGWNIHLSCWVACVWQKTRRLWVGTQARSKWHINVCDSIMGRGWWDPQLMNRLNGLSRVLIFWRATVPSDGNNFWTLYFASSTRRTVSPTPKVATRPEEVMTGTAGDGAAERPKNWNEDLKTKNKYCKIKERGKGMRGCKTKRHDIRKRM